MAVCLGGTRQSARQLPDAAGRAAGAAFHFRWIVKWNVLPWPTVLWTQIRPFIIRTSSDEMVRPRPEPPYLRVVEASPCLKASKDRVQLLGGNPHACVVHREMQADLRVAAPLLFDRDRDAALVGELDRVADQVQQDLAQPRRIAAHDRAAGRPARWQSA